MLILVRVVQLILTPANDGDSPFDCRNPGKQAGIAMVFFCIGSLFCLHIMCVKTMASICRKDLASLNNSPNPERALSTDSDAVMLSIKASVSSE